MIAATSGPSAASHVVGTTRCRRRAPGSDLTAIADAARRSPGWCRAPMSGTSTTLRFDRRAPRCAALIAIMPHSSPCAPAFGRQRDRRHAGQFHQIASATARRSARARPARCDCGCSGWMSPKPGSRAIFSLRRGLCFIVHEPSGKRPVSMRVVLAATGARSGASSRARRGRAGRSRPVRSRPPRRGLTAFEARARSTPVRADVGRSRRSAPPRGRRPRLPVKVWMSLAEAAAPAAVGRPCVFMAITGSPSARRRRRRDPRRCSSRSRRR